MKILVAIIFYCLFSLTIASAQKTRATLYFKDGVERKGFARLVGKQIKFRSNKKQKGRLFTFKDVEKVKIYHKRGTKTYAFVFLKEKKIPKLLELVLTGKIDWYKKIRQRHSNPVGSGNGLSFPGRSYTIEDSYLRRKKDSLAVHISSDRLFVKNFRKAASSFFKDCPKLVEKIQDNTFGREDIKKIIRFYNNSCP